MKADIRAAFFAAPTKATAAFDRNSDGENLPFGAVDNAAYDDIVKLGFEPETVQWVIRTIDRSEYKRRQAAIGLKVTTRAFGPGRRMPIAMRLNV